MIHVIKSTNDLPKGQSYRVEHKRPTGNVTAYEFTNWLQTVWFVVVDKPQPEYHGEGVA